MPALRIAAIAPCGASDLHALVMFAVDATKPFSTPAGFP
jgi:hypothetical protein